MATISNTPRPGYVWDATDNVWYPIGVGGHSHSEIAKTIVDAKGDLIVGTAADTVDRLAVGNSGEQIVADSSTATGLRYQPTMAAGKNICINGGFDIWQRGTSFTTFVYTADRWKMNPGGTVTVSQDTDVPTGVGVRYSLKQLTSASSSYSQYQMGFEQATTIPMRNQVYTFSFYMKANGTWSGAFSPQIYYSNSSDTLSTIMSGTLVTATGNTAPTPTTSWVRYAVTFTVPSDAVGIGVYFAPAAVQASGAALWIAGCQWEIGSVATAFTRTGGSIQGELAAAQRYYWLLGSGTTGVLGTGFYQSGSRIHCPVVFPNTMRTAPTLVSTSGTNYYNMQTVSDDNFNSLQIATASTQSCYLYNASEVSGTFGNAGTVFTNNASASIAFSAEL